MEVGRNSLKTAQFLPFTIGSLWGTETFWGAFAQGQWTVKRAGPILKEKNFDVLERQFSILAATPPRICCKGRVWFKYYIENPNPIKKLTINPNSNQYFQCLNLIIIIRAQIRNYFAYASQCIQERFEIWKQVLTVSSRGGFWQPLIAPEARREGALVPLLLRITRWTKSGLPVSPFALFPPDWTLGRVLWRYNTISTKRMPNMHKEVDKVVLLSFKNYTPKTTYPDNPLSEILPILD